MKSFVIIKYKYTQRVKFLPLKNLLISIDFFNGIVWTELMILAES